jgi:transcriptional regulator GlxA family with amidase domain
MDRVRRLRARRVALVVYDGVQSLDVVGPVEVFAGANAYLRRAGSAAPGYEIVILGPRVGQVRTSSGLRLSVDRTFASVRGGIDTLVVAGGQAREAASSAALLSWLRRMAPRVRRLVSVCTGAFVLAAAGLLAGRRATTHWAATGALKRVHPDIDIDPDALFVRDGDVYTSAGVTAGMDLALALVEEDHGRAVALSVARHLVLFLKRPGGQSQFSAHLAAQTIAGGPMQELPEWVVEHLGEDLSVESLARRVAMSPRNFARVFTRETGTTPARFVARARIEGARRALEDTGLPIDAIASRCGFGSAEHMRRTFRRHLRVVPREYRRRFEADRPDGRPPAGLRAGRRGT